VGVVRALGGGGRGTGRRQPNFAKIYSLKFQRKKEKFRQKREKMAKKGKKFTFPDLLCKNPYDLQPE
jgi:hypothetical protein